MSHIFMSYATKDGGDVARALVIALEAAGLRCWVAPRDVTPAIPYPGQIVDAVSESAGMVVLLTPDANQSPDVLQEVTLAHNARKLIAAVMVQGTEPAGGLTYFLVARHRIAWSEPRAIAAALKKVFGPAPPPDGADDAEAERKERKAAAREAHAEVRYGAAALTTDEESPWWRRIAPAVVGVGAALVLVLVLGVATLSLKAFTHPAPAEPAAPAAADGRSGGSASSASQSALPERPHAPGTSFRDCPVCPEMVNIPAGDFMMGSPSDEQDHEKYEEPQHPVHIRAFAASKTPITVGEWRKYVDDTGSTSHSKYCMWDSPGYPQDDRHPVVCVTWQQAQDYARWVSKKSGQTYRLLTEAEYEYANRAGSQTAYFWGNSPDDLPRHASNNSKGTTPVSSFKPNDFRLYDTTGNVWEWTQDCWHDNYEGAPTDDRAWEAGGDCTSRVVRGGSWFNNNTVNLRSASRNPAVDDGGRDVGLRLARTAF